MNKIINSVPVNHKTESGSQRAMVAKYAENVKMDGKLSDPAWIKAPEYHFELADNAYSKEPESLRKSLGDTLRENGTAKMLWNHRYLYVGAKMEDSDVVAEGKADQTHLYQTGDLVEVFLKPANETFYWEIYGAPNNMKTCFFFPGRGRIFVPSCAEYKSDIIVSASVDGTLNDWRDRDRGWSVEIAIPVETLTRLGTKFDNASEWTILLARYNYSRYLPMKECSSAPRLSAPNNHIYEDYARLILEQ
jgi:hypothetical protein